MGMVMRVPAELLAFYPGEIGHKAYIEDNGPPPVLASASFRSALPEALPQTGQASGRGAAPGQGRSAPEQPPRNRRRGDTPGDTAQRADRRVATLPVLLDTRLIRSRRQSDRRAAISLEA